MEQVEYFKLNELEKKYWWHKGKLYLLKEILSYLFGTPQKKLQILEIGSGTGFLTMHLLEYGSTLGVEISSEAIAYSKKRGVTNLIQADINEMKIPSDFNSKFDLVVALDVLEHIQDDVRTMEIVNKILKPGGFFVINVPAHKFLWSEHDEALHHKRRYTMTEIVKKLKTSGFIIQKKSYFVSTFFFAIWFYRSLRNIFTDSTYPKTSYVMLPLVINEFMAKILFYEAKLAVKTGLPIGTTITVISKKGQ